VVVVTAGDAGGAPGSSAIGRSSLFVMGSPPAGRGAGPGIAG